jgi:hypothetical protein
MESGRSVLPGLCHQDCTPRVRPQCRLYLYCLRRLCQWQPGRSSSHFPLLWRQLGQHAAAGRVALAAARPGPRLHPHGAHSALRRGRGLERQRPALRRAQRQRQRLAHAHRHSKRPTQPHQHSLP